MQTNRFLTCHLEEFDNANNFWISSIEGLLERFPQLEIPHENTFYTVLIIEKAIGKITTDDKKTNLDTHQTIIIKPHCITQLVFNHKAKGTIICFNEDFFSLRYNNNILNQFTFLSTSCHTLIRVNSKKLLHINTMAKNMIEEFQMIKKASKKVLRSYLNIILIEIERLYTPLQTIEENNPMKEKIHKFQKLVKKHFTQYKKPSDYAQMLNISTNYLNKICKNYLGETSGEIIRKHITLEAQRLLHYTNDSISEIAHSIGYEHTSYFVSMFKKSTSQTPEQYRKKRTEE